MRKVNPAVKAGLSAALVMGMGTVAIVGVDNMLHGDLPVASAASRGTVSVVHTTNEAAKGNPDPDNTDDDTFSTSGEIKLTASGGHSGPFHATWALPTEWAAEEGSFRNVTVSGASNAQIKVAAPDDKNCVTSFDLTVSDSGIPTGSSITIKYEIYTVKPRTFKATDPDDRKNEITDMLTKLNRRAPIIQGTGIIYDKDWSQAGFTMSMSPIPDLAPGDSATGTITATFTGNSAGVILSAPTIEGTASTSNAVSFEIINQSSGWLVTKKDGTTAGHVSLGVRHDFDEGDVATLSFKVTAKTDSAAKYAMDNDQRATVKVSGSGTGTATDGSHAGAAVSPKTAEQTFGIAKTSITAAVASIENQTNPGLGFTTGDTAVITVKVTSGGKTAAGQKVRVALDAADSPLSAVKITTPLPTGVSSSSTQAWFADITLPQMGANETLDYRIPVKIGDVTNNSLNGKSVKVNVATSLFGTALPDARELGAKTPAAGIISIAWPKVDATSQVTDPQLMDDTSAYSEDMVSNIGDEAAFRIVFSNNSDQVVKGVTNLTDTIWGYDKDDQKLERALTNTVSQICILNDSIKLTKVSANGQEEPVAITKVLDPAAAAEYPYNLRVTPTGTVNIEPGASLVLQYRAKMSTVTNKNMRGGTFRNAPKMTAQNISQSSAPSSTVKIATAQISAALTATKSQIGLGDKTTYVTTVQSVAKKTTTVTDEYAVGMHFTAVLDDYTRGYGYKFDKDSTKLYYVSGGKVVNNKPVDASEYDIAWVVPENDMDLKELSFTVDLKDSAAAKYKIKNVSETAAKAVSDAAAAESANRVKLLTEGISALVTEASTDASDATDATTKTDTTAAPSRGDDVDAIAKDIKEGFIITFDGTTEHIRSDFTDTMTSTTEVRVRADNAGFSIQHQDVDIVGAERVLPRTTWQPEDESTENPAPNDSGTDGKNATNQPRSDSKPSPLLNTDVEIPASITALLAGIAGYGLTLYRKIKRR